MKFSLGFRFTSFHCRYFGQLCFFQKCYFREAALPINDRVIIKGPLQLNRFAKQLNMTRGELINIMKNQGVSDDEIGTIISTESMELIMNQLSIPFENISKSSSINFSISEKSNNVSARSPIVTIMGHIDHGKTTLLDALRRSSIVESEHGGITQKIGAFTAKDSSGGSICFIDTPGHFAFHSSRSRGIQATDIALLIISVTDGIQEQTIECIRLAKAAKTPLIVVINKMDKPNEGTLKIECELLDYGIKTQLMGGTVDCIPISAKTESNLDNLLASISLLSTSLALNSSFPRVPTGFILECTKDRYLGNITSVILKSGSLACGDHIQTETSFCRIKVIIDENGDKPRVLKPSFPVKIAGWVDTPRSGEIFQLCTIQEFKDRRRKLMLAETSKDLVMGFLQDANYEIGCINSEDTDGEDVVNKPKNEDYNKSNPLQYNIFIKADNYGSIDALIQSIAMINEDFLRINIHGCGIGSLNGKDYVSAMYTRSIIYGFNWQEYDLKVLERIQQEHNLPAPKIIGFDVIYDLFKYMKEDIEKKLGYRTVYEEVGKLLIQQIYKFTGTQKIVVAGCKVLSGMVLKGEDIQVALIRDNEVYSNDTIISIKSLKRDVETVYEGNECGIILKDEKKFKENDLISVFRTREEKLKLNWII